MTRIHDIGPFRIDSEAGVLTKAGVPMALGSRAVAVLTALVERANEYVAKSSLMDAAWPGVVVEESNLAVQISAIRRVLAQAPGGEHWVETLARRGYRFVGPVTALPDAPAQADAAKSSRTNLPEALTSFIGREREIAEIKRLLPGSRLLTIVGIGGIGKTRLAAVIADTGSSSLTHGVYWVDLAAVSDPALVPLAIANSLGLRLTEELRPVEALVSMMRRMSTLLVLDNCEHLIDAVATVANALVIRTANVRLLVTSREPVKIPGEEIYRLEGLSVPVTKMLAKEAEAHGAVALFVARAKAADRRFRITDEYAGAVIEICRRLDGVPLAIELAAARVPMLGLSVLCDRLDERFKLLVGRSRSASPRQQTMLATLDWSYGLLSAAERSLFNLSAVFCGGFTLEGCRAVASEGDRDEWVVIDTLASLIDKSMVTVREREPPRYLLLDTVRSYGIQKLVEENQLALAQQKHGEYYASFFDVAYDEWLTWREVPWRVRYLRELENLRAALVWAFGPQGDAALGARLAGASLPIWLVLRRQNAREGRTYFELGLAHASEPLPISVQARLCFGAGLLSVLVNAEKSRKLLERAIKLFRECGDDRGLAHALVEYARLVTRLGDHASAERALRDARRLVRDLNVPVLTGLHEIVTAFAHAMRGKRNVAAKHFRNAATLFESAGAESLAHQVTSDVADNAWGQGHLEHAAYAFRDLVSALRDSNCDNTDIVAVPLINLVGVLTELGKTAEALTIARQAVPILLDAGLAWIAYDALCLRLAIVGKYADAARLHGRSIAAYAASKTSEREPNERRMCDRATILLRENLGIAELEDLLAEGARLSDEDACRIALEGAP